MKNSDALFQCLFNEPKKTDEKIACVFQEDTISYADMLSRVRRLAHGIHSLTREQELIGIYMSRSPDLVCAILAILYAGRPFLPMDSNLPQERTQYILRDSGCRVILTDQHTDVPLSGHLIYFEDLIKHTAESGADWRPGAGRLAYLMYTSGSTGFPKGVMVSREALAAFLNNLKNSMNWENTRRILAITTITFDIFIMEMIFPFMLGMTIVLADDATTSNPRKIICQIIENSVDTVQMTPSRMLQLLSARHDRSWVAQLKKVCIGGENFPLSLLRELQRQGCKAIYNMYGPTEATVWAMAADLTHSDSIILGKPLGDTQVRLITTQADSEPRLGEISIAGKQLADGYWNQKEATEKSFHTYSDTREQRWYDTGDYAKMTEDAASLIFQGRKDEQIKIHGYRVELSEIQNCMESFCTISKAVVVNLPGKNHGEVFCGCYTADREISALELREHLKRFLPQYMIPEIFLHFPCFLETPNHKIDKQQLKQQCMKILKLRNGDERNGDR